MSKLQRYFIYGDNLYATYADEDALSSAYSICHEHGDWVKYEDVKELEEEIGNHKAENESIGTLLSELEEENERLKNRVQHLARRLRDCCSGAFVAIADE